MLRTQITYGLDIHPWAHTALIVNSNWCTSQPKQLSASHTVLQAAGSRTRQCVCAFQMHLNTRVSCNGTKLPVLMRSYLRKNTLCFRPARNCWNPESSNWCRCKGIEVWILLGKVNTNALFKLLTSQATVQRAADSRCADIEPSRQISAPLCPLIFTLVWVS